MGVGLPVDRLKPVGATRPKAGVVHLGLGAFFRAFGCVYIADAMAASGGDWGVVGVSLQSSRTADALRPQDWAYTSVSLGPNGEETRVIEVLNNVLVAPENPYAVLNAMADPNIKIVSLTVTEKGYCHNPATGRLNIAHPDIKHDLENETPKSAIGYLFRALQIRNNAQTPPFTVLTCDNLPENGKLVRGLVLEFAELIDPTFADWIKSECCFPSTMVDRITPATTDADIERVAKITGKFDAAPVMHEPFSQWAIEDNFVANTRPDFAAAGAEMVADVTAHEHMKLRMLNGTHSALAYTGYLAGHETIADTIADPVFAKFARALWAEIIPTVIAPNGVNLADYADALLARYRNPTIRHKTWQIAMDGSQKLPQRLLGTITENLESGRDNTALFLAVAAWMRYVSGSDELGRAIDVRDPMAATLHDVCQMHSTPSAKATALLSMREIFPQTLAEKLKSPIANAAEQIWERGARNAIQKETT
ncbi:mannitol dehydrogenase [Amylibacter kogurei]|uniref:Mannitol dehydrogenase n=1 Tax=Paramylibacter kogurei TaxID=1889778 RepID=A0A2G5K6Q8_9RHOB|nr:mannitol dehydrogenase family protein [Amylibacter kogurei]PIB25135.1 mannitol dehydrogenase [Amylibacter kogurei]